MSKDNIIPGDFFSPAVREGLEQEVVSPAARNRLTRLLRRKISSGNASPIYPQNQITNIVNRAMGRPGYVLEAGPYGYEDEEYAYHDGEFAAVLFRPETPVLADVLCDLINEEWLDADHVNAVMRADGCGFAFSSQDDLGVTVELFDLSELPDEQLSDGGHPNIRLLFDRMSRAMDDKDWPLVVATGASVAETLAKDIVANPSVQNQSLGGWFQSFRNHSNLPEEFLESQKRATAGGPWVYKCGQHNSRRGGDGACDHLSSRKTRTHAGAICLIENAKNPLVSALAQSSADG